MNYHLTSEPWIPVHYLDGDRGAVGLRDALAEAHRIREITAPPLQTAALYRLLQALVVRLVVHPPGAPDDAGWTDDAWRQLWDAGCLDVALVDGYLDAHRDRFDLLHPEHPFYGHPAPSTPSVGGTNWLVPTWAKGNNETLFDHTTDAACPPLALDEAARALVETQAFALGGLAGPGRTRFEDAPLSRALVFWTRGRSLFEALLLNTPPMHLARMPSGPDDLPLWERGGLPGTGVAAEKGYLDFLTWPSRHVRLVVDEAAEPPVVTGVHIAQGKKWVSERTDPLAALRTKKDGTHYPFKLRPEMALWRAAPAYLGLRLEGQRDSPPRPFEWIANSAGPDDVLDRPGEAALGWDVDVLGLANDKAKMEMIRADRVTLHPALLRSKGLQHTLAEAVQRAGRQAASLRGALRECAAHVATGNDAPTVADGLQGERRFWALLQTGFAERGTRHEGFDDWLAELARVPTDTPAVAGALDPDDAEDALANAAEYHLALWTRTLHRAAGRAYDQATEAFVGTPRRMEGVARGRARLRPPAAYAPTLAAPAP